MTNFCNLGSGVIDPWDDDRPDTNFCTIGYARTEPVDSYPAITQAKRTPFAARCYAFTEPHLAGYRIVIGFNFLKDAQDALDEITRQSLNGRDSQ